MHFATTAATASDQGDRPRPQAAVRCLVAFALAAALILSVTVPAGAAMSGDVAGSIYEPAVTALQQVGIIGPEWSITLKPQELLTRAEEARLLSRALTGETNARGFLPLRFPDVSSDNWAKPYIDTAVYLKLMPGHANVAFNPNGKVTRGQYATDILKLCGYHPANGAAAMATAIDLSLIDSSDSATYAYITRGDAVTMAYRAFFGVANPELGSTLACRVFGTTLRPAPAGESAPTLELHFLPAVGATLVRLPSGADWLVNTGSPATLPSLFAYLGRLGVDRLDALIVTGSGLSPVGAVAAVTDRLSPENIVRLDSTSSAPVLPASLLALDKDVKVDLIYPNAGSQGYRTALRISRGSLRAVLGNALDEDDERAVAVQNKAKLAAEVWLPSRLGVFAQHDLGFMTAVAPDYVVGQAAANADQAALYEGLTTSGAKVLLPDADGVVKVVIGTKAITIPQSQPLE